MSFPVAKFRFDGPPNSRALRRRELRAIELEENENRKSLTAAERSKTFRAAKQVVEDAKKVKAVSSQSETKPQGGRPAKYVKKKDEVAADIGVSRNTLERAEQHVSTAEQFPFMQGALTAASVARPKLSACEQERGFVRVPVFFEFRRRPASLTRTTAFRRSLRQNSFLRSLVRVLIPERETSGYLYA